MAAAGRPPTARLGPTDLHCMCPAVDTLTILPSPSLPSPVSLAFPAFPAFLGSLHACRLPVARPLGRTMLQVQDYIKGSNWSYKAALRVRWVVHWCTPGC